ncbi:hypothetical protein DYD21_04825 [Rhodohalobacter sp. SW132]|nr:hypothetical protein DYD21_04825 [Rhodohalobacter sp. SW132]
MHVSLNLTDIADLVILQQLQVADTKLPGLLKEAERLGCLQNPFPLFESVFFLTSGIGQIFFCNYMCVHAIRIQ